MNTIKKTLTLVSLIAFCGGLTACNTISGAGKDIERGGEKIQNKSSEVKNRN